MTSLKEMAGICRAPWPLPPGLLRESLERAAAGYDAARAPETPGCGWRFVGQVYLRAPHGPDRLVFGDVDAQPRHKEPDYSGAPLACTTCKAGWRGKPGEKCWACGDGRGDYA
jgi:hypothetical protein